MGNNNWPTIQGKMLLAKHGKISLPTGTSNIPDSDILAIANEMDKQEKQEQMEGSYDIPEQYRTSLSNAKTPKAGAIIIQPDSENDAKNMINAYIKKNGSYVVPKGKTPDDVKKELTNKNDDKLLFG